MADTENSMEIENINTAGTDEQKMDNGKT